MADGYQPEPYLRSKVKVTSDRNPPEWSFDGSSTQQADTEGSDCILIPVQEYKNPLFGDYWLCVECKQVPVKLIQLT